MKFQATFGAYSDRSHPHPHTVREVVLTALRAWKYVLKHFDDVRLDAKKGSFFNALEDYGSFKAKLTFNTDLAKHGVKFMGTPFYDKKNRSKERELRARSTQRLGPFTFTQLISSSGRALAE